MKALVIGIDGGIGRALAKALVARGDAVIGTTRRASEHAADALPLDLATDDITELRLPNSDVAFICAAMASLAECRKNPELSHRVNALAPAALARRLVAQGTRVVFISTNAVYDWQSPLVAASTPPNPLTIYGQQKVHAEAAITKLGEGATILRLTKVLTPDLSLFRGWIEALSTGQDVQAFTDMHLAPLALSDAVDALVTLAESSQSGLFQISGARDVSYFEAAQHLAHRIGADLQQVKPSSARELGFAPAEITTYSSLSSARYARLTGWVPPDPYSTIDAVFGHHIASAKQRAPE